MIVNVYPIDISPLSLLSQYEETQARLRKIRDDGYKVISISGCEFRKLLRDNPDLKKKLSACPYVKNSPIFEMPCTGVEPKPQKPTTEPSREKKCACYQSVPLHL